MCFYFTLTTTSNDDNNPSASDVLGTHSPSKAHAPYQCPGSKYTRVAFDNLEKNTKQPSNLLQPPSKHFGNASYKTTVS